MRVDSHQHFWRYTPEDYPWIAPDWKVLRRDFLPDDLAPLLAAHQLDGAIAVQAQQTIDETLWLLDLAAQRPEVIAGVVGWVPLIDAGVNDTLERLVEAGSDVTGRVRDGIRRAGPEGMSAAELAGALGVPLPDIERAISRHWLRM